MIRRCMRVITDVKALLGSNPSWLEENKRIEWPFNHWDLVSELERERSFWDLEVLNENP